MDPEIVGFIAIEAGCFVVGFMLGALSFRTIVLPLTYSLTRALWWAVRGRLRWRAVPGYFFSPVLWCVIFGLAAYALTLYAPKAWEQLYSSPLFYLGLCVAIGLRAFRTLGSKSGQRKLRHAFLDSVKSDFKLKADTQEQEMGEDIYQPIWHLSRGGKRYGPFSYEELQRRAVRGKMQENDLLWRPGVSEWVEASSILEPAKNSKR